MALEIDEAGKRLVRTVHEGNAEVTLTVQLPPKRDSYEPGKKIEIPVREARSSLAMWAQYDQLPPEARRKVEKVVSREYQHWYERITGQKFEALTGKRTLKDLKLGVSYTSYTPDLSPSIQMGEQCQLQFVVLHVTRSVALGTIVGIRQLQPSLS